MSKKLTLILWNIRSVYNVGAILRTADGLGVSRIVYAGYTPHPDKGLPHERIKLREAIHKTALGAEFNLPSEHTDDLPATIAELKQNNTQILALEQAKNSIPLQNFTLSQDCALILGEECYGIPPELLALCDHTLEIPMVGTKESFNVSVAAGIALWQLLKP